jgi:hypothetical protein
MQFKARLKGMHGACARTAFFANLSPKSRQLKKLDFRSLQRPREWLSATLIGSR